MTSLLGRITHDSAKHDKATPDAALDRIASATKDLEPPFAAVDSVALDFNASQLITRSNALPVRVASKSVRSRAILGRVLGRDRIAESTAGSNTAAGQGFQGIMAYSTAEALWLAGTGDQHGVDGVENILMGYPSVDTTSLAAITRDPVLSSRITLMVDDVAHLDIIRAAAGSDRLAPRICIDVDASLRIGPAHIGVRRSPLREPAQVAELARVAHARGFHVVGVMFYEAQIAGLPDSNRAVELMKRLSASELLVRRQAVVSAVTDVVGPLEIVNGGGTGSLEVTSADPVVTEVTAGSGLFLPALFDRYKAFPPNPALYFALPVLRKPTASIATAFGGGYIASGPVSATRVPLPVGFSNAVRGVTRGGLKMIRNEGAGEVQTPLRGAESVAIGDRIWFRHAKAGEVCERFDTLYVIDADGGRTAVPTYRGESKNFG